MGHCHLTVPEVTGIISAVGTVAAASAAWFTASQARDAARHADKTADRAIEALSATLRPKELTVRGQCRQDLPANTDPSYLVVGTPEHMRMYDVTAFVQLGTEEGRAAAPLMGRGSGMPGALRVPVKVAPDLDPINPDLGGKVVFEFTDDRHLGRWRADIDIVGEVTDRGEVGVVVQVHPEAVYIRTWTFLGVL